MASVQRKFSFRSESHLFFIYDHRRKTEADDPKDAILYFYPRSVKTDDQIALVGGLIGLTDFCLEFLPQEMPHSIKLSGHTFAMMQAEDYILGLSGSSDIPDKSLLEHMQFLWSTFVFYQGSISAIRQRSVDGDFLKELHSVWDIHLPLCQSQGDILGQSFKVLPHIQLHKSQGNIFLHASHILQRSLKHSGVIAGALFNKNKVLCSQFDNPLTRTLLLLMLHSQFPGVDIDSVLELPGGVRLMYIFMTRSDYKKLGYRRKTAFSIDDPSWSFVNKSQPGTQPTDFTDGFLRPKPSPFSFVPNKSPAQGEPPPRQHPLSSPFYRADSELSNKSSTYLSSRASISSPSFVHNSGTDSEVFVDSVSDLKNLRKDNPSRLSSELTSGKFPFEASTNSVSRNDVDRASNAASGVGKGEAVDISKGEQGRESVKHQSKFSHETKPDVGNPESSLESHKNVLRVAEEDNVKSDINKGSDFISKTTDSMHLDEPDSLSGDVRHEEKFPIISTNQGKDPVMSEGVKTNGIMSEEDKSKERYLQGDIINDGAENRENGDQPSDLNEGASRREKPRDLNENVKDCVVNGKDNIVLERSHDINHEYLFDKPVSESDCHRHQMGDSDDDGTSVDPKQSLDISTRPNSLRLNSPHSSESKISHEPRVSTTNDSLHTKELSRTLHQHNQEIDDSLALKQNISGDDSSTHSSADLRFDEDNDKNDYNHRNNSLLSLATSGVTRSKDRLVFERVDSENSDPGIISPMSEVGRLSPVSETADISTSSVSFVKTSNKENVEGAVFEDVHFEDSGGFEPSDSKSEEASSGTQSAGWRPQDHDLEELSLYIQGHSDTLLVLLLDKGTVCNKDSIHSLWKSSLSHLAELDFEVKNIERFQKDDIETLGSCYHFMHYDSFTQNLIGSAKFPVTNLANEMVDACVRMHEDFTLKPGLEDTIYRSHTAACYGCRSVSGEVYFQIGAQGPIGGNVYWPGDKTFYLDAIAKALLKKDHNISIY